MTLEKEHTDKESNMIEPDFLIPSYETLTSPTSLILLGAGSKAREAVAYLRHTYPQKVNIACLADNDRAKQGKHIIIGDEIFPILSPLDALVKFPQARWTASVISYPAAKRLRSQLCGMEVSTIPFHRCLPQHFGLPSWELFKELCLLTDDSRTVNLLVDQWQYRSRPDESSQLPPDDIRDLYFPSFIRSLGSSEVFVDCGAADGDTLQSFLARNPSPRWITAFEPDPENFNALQQQFGEDRDRIRLLNAAVSSHTGRLPFAALGDNHSHCTSSCCTEATGVVDTFCLDDPALFSPPPSTYLPTYVKMDIEGAELDALWGARKLLEESRPVLAICAYHISDHLWKIPLLVRLLEPSYRLFLRRYAEGTWELVWYAVPEERLDRSKLGEEGRLHE